MDILAPADYLNNWSRHQLYQSELMNSEKIPPITNVNPDMRINGKISVTNDASITSIDENNPLNNLNNNNNEFNEN